MNSNVIIVAIVAVVIVGAGAGVYIALNNGNSDSGEKEIEPRDVTIKDSLGNDITITAPITKVCTVNTNAAEFFQMLGVNERIVGMDTSGKAALGKTYENVTDIGDYKTPNGEKIAQTGAKYVISQSSSRSMSTETEQALKDNYGIIVLRMDFFGETMMTDVEELLKILISDSASTAFEEYKTTYNNVISTVKNVTKDVSGNPSFLFLMASMSSTAGTYYSTSSELSKIVTDLHGHNAQTDMNVTSKTSTFKPAASKVLEISSEGHDNLGYVFIRGTDGQTAAQSYQVFLNTGGDMEFADNLKVVEHRHVYVINTDVLSGPRDYIGRVCIANAYGIDVGLNSLELVNQFNQKYGFEISYSYIMTQFPAA